MVYAYSSTSNGNVNSTATNTNWDVVIMGQLFVALYFFLCELGDEERGGNVCALRPPTPSIHFVPPFVAIFFSSAALPSFGRAPSCEAAASRKRSVFVKGKTCGNRSSPSPRDTIQVCRPARAGSSIVPAVLAPELPDRLEVNSGGRYWGARSLARLPVGRRRRRRRWWWWL